MHELSLFADLTRKVDDVVRRANGERAAEIVVKLGALSHMSAEHFQEHFDEVSKGTIAEGARLAVEESDDPHDPHAQDMVLQSVEVEFD
jgi:hydrogenase nickel incorporation protein HypA/HybF